MRKLYLLLGVAAILASCSGGKTEQSDFSLTGKFSDNKMDGKSIYLQKIDSVSQELVSTDTLNVQNGAFSFTTKSGAPQIAFIAGDSISKPIPFVFEGGSLEVAFDSLMLPNLKGTELNNKLQAYNTTRDSINQAMLELRKLAKQAQADNKLTAEYEKELESKDDALYEKLKTATFNFANDNIDNVVGQYIFLDRGRSFDEKQLGEIIPKAADKLQSNSIFTTINNRYQALKATAVGNLFTDLKGNTPDGKEISLSEYAGKGKIVLIDFWASWCPPCRKEMPHVVKIYDQYKNKGFEIVGVSLDTDKAAWIKGIKDLHITWPQMSDLKGWKTELGATYAINSIPHMVLLDKEGKIIARGITAEDLEKQLPELLK